MCFSTVSNIIGRDFGLGSSEQKLAPQWVTGISDSEGNFSIFTQKTKNGYKFTLAYKVTQKHHSAGILYDLERYYECGNVQIDNRKENAFKFNVNKLVPSPPRSWLSYPPIGGTKKISSHNIWIETI